ncbi:MAG: hypothetical protein GY796_30970 [Chloroflexi bacterium]|nr:hypothetical protein [Chloroflexota bacterium]
MQPSYKTMDEHQHVFNLIWSQMSEMQKRTSSSWWFFILFPKEAEGYGPRQMMFSIATRVGERIRISDVWLPGVDLSRSIQNGVDEFPAQALGWYYDGQQVHEDIVKETAVTHMSLADKNIHLWNEQENGEELGYEISAVPHKPLTLAAHIKGDKGEAHFEAWGDLDCLDSSPHESINIDTPIAGTHFIAWRRMNFKGKFNLPGTGQETLEGLCYFQRVCLNVPLFPWKWIWAFFPDGSVFSAYVPYVGLNLFRKGYKFFNSNRKEQATLPIGGTAFWDWNGAAERIWLKNCRVTPILGRGPHPQFKVETRNKQGDYINFLAAPYGHTRFFIDRPILRGRKESHWNYNEYMFRMQSLDGRIQGQPITQETMGQGFGSLEYTWGLGL